MRVLVLDVIQEKHTEARTPSKKSFDDYSVRSPKLFPLEMTEDTAMKVSQSISGGARPGATGSVSLQD